MSTNYESRSKLRKSKRNKRRIKHIIGVILALTLMVGAAGGYVLYRTNNSLSNIKRADLLPSDNKKNNATKAVSHQPLTYLLLGSDTRGTGDSGRSDSIMVGYVPADRKHVYLMSLPRDLYVNIPGHDRQKINASYELGGSKLTVETIQNLLGINLQHVAIVNFNGFVGLVDTLGGVKVNNPYGGCDTSQNICWKQGDINLKSWTALHYVRWRHGLPDGDITRAQNQQRVLKAIFSKSLSAGTLSNPVKLTNLIDKASKNITVDSTLTNDVIKDTLLNMNVSSSSDIRSFTLPIAEYKDVPTYGSVDVINYSRLEELKKALANDTVDAYWSKYNKVSPVGATPAETEANKIIEEELTAEAEATQTPIASGDGTATSSPTETIGAKG